MSLKGAWIDPDDDDVVTIVGSPETGSPETAIIKAIADKSDSGNDVRGSLAVATFLASFDGADGDTAFTSEDDGARVATFVEACELDSAQSKFGDTSLALGASSPGRVVTFPDSADWSFGSGQFTAEFWVRWDGDPASNSYSMLGHYDHDADERSWLINYNTNELRFAWTTNGTGGTYSELVTAWNPVGEQWYHVAMSRDASNDLRFFVDGVLLRTVANAVTYHTATSVLSVGATATGNATVVGWMDDVRIIKGEAIYTAAFTPPTRAHVLLRGPIASFDTGLRGMRFDADSGLVLPLPDVSFLANFEDVETGSPLTATEESENAATMTFENGANVDTAQFKFGVSSAEFPNATSAISMPNIPDYDFGTGDFTIEMWIRTTASQTAAQIPYENRGGSPVGGEPVIYINNFGTLHWYVDADRIDSAAGVIAIDTWYHIAVAREDAVTKMFVDGVQVGSNYADTNDYVPNADLVLGNDWAGTGQLKGWMDSVRIVKGEAIYTEDFVPPTAPHSASELRDMNGPDFTVVVALDLDDESPEVFDISGEIISTYGASSPLDDSGWRIAAEGKTISAFVGGAEESRIVLSSPNAVFLANFDGADGIASPPGYESEDDSARPATFLGDAQLDTAQFKFGVSSALFDGTGDTITFPDSDDFDFGNGDFTIEFWVRFNGDPGTGDVTMIAKTSTVASQQQWTVALTNNSMRVNLSTTGADNTTNDQAWNPVGSQWYHVSAERFNDALYHYVDGVQLGTEIAYSSTLFANTPPLNISGVHTGSYIQLLNGWIDDVRILKGESARQGAASFDVPIRAHQSHKEDALILDGRGMVALSLDQTGNYFVGHTNGIESGVKSFSGALGFSHPLSIGDSFIGSAMAEVVYVDGLLRTDERQRVEGYLAHKWGFAASLPVGHPFASEGPDIVIDAAFVANFDGADGDTSYTSETGDVGTFIATAALDNAQQKFGDDVSPLLTSAFFDGGSDYITFPQSTDHDLTDADFTLECWVRFNGDPGTTDMAFISKWDTAPLRSYSFGMYNAGNLGIYYSTNGSDAASVDSAWDPDGDVWYHVAAVRFRDEWTFYVDGVALASSQTVAVTLATVSAGLWIGGNENTGALSNPMNGWIDSTRVTVGEALYLREFTPPLREFVLPVAAALLANFNGPDGIASPPGYVSEDVNAWLPVFAGNAQLDTAEKKFGISSLLMDGSGDYVEFGSGSPLGFELLTQDFTFEFWFRPADTSVSNIASAGVTAANQWSIYFDGTGSDLHVQTAGTARGSGGTFSTVQWYHIALTRSGDDWVLYADGVSIITFTISTSIDIGAIGIGRRNGSSNTYNGHIDGVRLVIGSVLYTAAFTVPIDAPGEPII